MITPEELAAHLDDPGWVVVDCRFTLTDPAAGPATYARSHIPGARYANLDQDLSRRPAPSDGRHPLPAASDFAARLGAWGIDARLDRRRLRRGKRRDRGAALVAARLARPRSPPRARRRLRGVERGAGCRSSPRTPRWQPVRFVPRTVADDSVVEAADLPALQAAGDLLVDARAAPRYRGEQEPIDPVAGHVPGAVNRPGSANVDANGRFRAPDALRGELDRAPRRPPVRAS